MMNRQQCRLYTGLIFFLIIQGIFLLLTNITHMPENMYFGQLDHQKLINYLNLNYNFSKISTTKENDESVINVEQEKMGVFNKESTDNLRMTDDNERMTDENIRITDNNQPISDAMARINEESTSGSQSIKQNTIRHLSKPNSTQNSTKETKQHKNSSKRENSTKESTKKLLTIFTTFSDAPERESVQSNTLCNYLNFPENQVNLVIFSSNITLTRLQLKVETKCLTRFPYVEIADRWHVIQLNNDSMLYERPILKDMYREIMQRYDSKFYMYTNGDILYPWRHLRDSLDVIFHYTQLNGLRRYIIFGLRKEIGFYNFNFNQSLKMINLHDLETGSDEEILKLVEGVNVTRKRAMDYFITSRVSFPWEWIPKFIIGVEKYDNWLLVYANKVKITTFDISNTNPVIHQAGAPKAINDAVYHQANAYNHKLFENSLIYPTNHICVHNCCRMRTEMVNHKQY
ncbi:unnamed protein product [Owenia fusiformis]|uniref:Uncharacterized protein n=1 Tax=Owenia fusiformis TaxID=6347 RepID=A0A8S4NBT0_OWEFU|nr:unnamed protein product [Owenia fusiformis]